MKPLLQQRENKHMKSMTKKQHLGEIHTRIQQEQNHIDQLTKDIEKFERLAREAGSPVKEQAHLVAEQTRKSLASSREVLRILEAHAEKVEDEVPQDWRAFG
jgi:hypothetical protein